MLTLAVLWLYVQVHPDGHPVRVKLSEEALNPFKSAGLEPNQLFAGSMNA